MRKLNVNVELAFDYKYWTTGCINLNFHTKTFEIEFLCFACYVDLKTKLKTNRNGSRF